MEYDLRDFESPLILGPTLEATSGTRIPGLFPACHPPAPGIPFANYTTVRPLFYQGAFTVNTVKGMLSLLHEIPPRKALFSVVSLVSHHTALRLPGKCSTGPKFLSLSFNARNN